MLTPPDRTRRRPCPVGFALGLLALTGCSAGVTEPLPGPVGRAPAPVASSNRPEGPYARPGAAAPAADAAAPPEISWETKRDEKYARFLRQHSGGMVRKAAVGIEKRRRAQRRDLPGRAPEDTLPLTKSLMAGARKDFPDRPITLSPSTTPRASRSSRRATGPARGSITRSPTTRTGAGRGDARDGRRPPAAGRAAADPLRGAGVTERDQKFAAWAEEHGRPMLRYVEADLERHGRLWFGITREVKPADVQPLTQSLLEGARKEFPRGDLVATVFDPEGERIGRAHLRSGGEVRWEQ